jgi:hypothetical protein
MITGLTLQKFVKEAPSEVVNDKSEAQAVLTHGRKEMKVHSQKVLSAKLPANKLGQ